MSTRQFCFLSHIYAPDLIVCDEVLTICCMLQIGCLLLLIVRGALNAKNIFLMRVLVYWDNIIVAAGFRFSLNAGIHFLPL